MKNFLLRFTTRRAFTVGAIALVAFAFYAARLLENTPGFYLDEAAIAYNALHLARHGSDENGVPFPLYPLFYRDFYFATIANPAYIYGLAAVFLIVSPSIFAARLFSAALGFAAAITLGLLARRLHFDFLRRQNGKPEFSGDLRRRVAVASHLAGDGEETIRASTRSDGRGADFVGLIVFFATLATPWLYEISRLVFEVALMPLALALFLLLLHRAQDAARAAENGSWPLSHSISLALSLALVVYSYSIGRLLGPLLALGLIFFATRGGWRGVLTAWAFFTVTILPYAIYTANHPGSLTARFYVLSYLTPQSTFASALPDFLTHLRANANPLTLLTVGDLNLRHHLPAFGAFLAGFYALGVLGFVSALWRPQRSSWWIFIAYGTFCALLPVSLTRYDFHALQMIAFPVFLLIWIAPAVSWLISVSPSQAAQMRDAAPISAKSRENPKSRASARNAKTKTPVASTRTKVPRWKTALLSVFLLGAAAQFIWFQMRFQRERPFLGYVYDAFDSDFPPVFQAALDDPKRPIFLEDGDFPPVYPYAWWYGATVGMDRAAFVRLKRGQQAPHSALVISSVKGDCGGCTILAQSPQFKTYLAP